MIVAHVSLTPREGAVWAASEAFAQAGHESVCIAPGGYESGRAVPTDLPPPPCRGALDALGRAEVIFCHDGWPYAERWYPRGTPTVGWYHAPATDPDGGPSLKLDGWPWGVSAFGAAGASPDGTRLPDLLPLGHELYRPADKPAHRVRLAYCPSPAAGGCRGEASYEAMLAAWAGLNADVDVLAGLAPARRLRRMAAAHVVLDDAFGGPTRSSLEGLALGCVVVSGDDGRAAWEALRLTGGWAPPLEAVPPGGLRRTLRRLTGYGPATLARMGRRNRRWMEAAWRPGELIDRNVLPLVRAALRHARDMGVRNLAPSALSGVPRSPSPVAGSPCKDRIWVQAVLAPLAQHP